jgi:exopolysaccharide biosynthesis predicted pyruvyltransferase EpsI
LLDIPEDVDLILFEGGGYINDIWYGPTLLKQIMKRNSQQIAIGPHSLKFTKTDFSSYFQDQRPVEIFCREKYSYLHLNKLVFPVNVKIKVSKDTAFYLEKSDLETGTLCEEYDLICFRTDKESALTSKQKKEVITGSEKPFIQDISIDGTFTEFINKVEKAKKIYTDRLHVAILGYIFEKDVTLYGNRYHKNRGVWEYCLKDQVNFEIL